MSRTLWLPLALLACTGGADKEAAGVGDSGTAAVEDCGDGIDDDGDGLTDCDDPDCDCPDTGDGGGGSGTGGEENRAPDGLVVAIAPAAPTPGESLVCGVVTAATDPDGDAVTVDYAWDRGGTDMGLGADTVPAGTTTDGETWTCTAVPTDGTDAGPPATDSVSVACPDSDGDGARDAACGGEDCDDADPAVGPGAVDVLNGIDDDCDGTTDEAVVLVVSGHACTAQGIAADDAALLETWVEDLGLGADVVLEPATGLDASSAPLANLELVIYTKCGWAWQSFNQGTVDHLSTAHGNGVSTLVVDDDGSLFSTTELTGATDLVLLAEPASNGSTSGTDWVVSSGVSHPALSGPAGTPAAFTYGRDSDDTTLLASGATVLMERADTGGPVWVLQSLATGARSGILLANVARTAEGPIDTTSQSALEVIVKNSVDWLVD
jgi:hypothetical protein